jgi:predicted GIY-YIG superfamily endonuclease
MGAREYFVYRAFNADGELLYVGCTKRPGLRWAEHKSMRPRMVAEAVRFRVQGPYLREVALQIERVAIRTEEPLYGWTPTKNAEKRARDRWITKQSDALVDAGMGWPEAVHKAVAAAREYFPDPNAHERVRADA